MPAATSASIRILHHWACSGGTILSRCVASLPEVVLLSEVHPLAYLRLARPYPYYFPTDLIQQLCLPHNGRDPALCVAAWNGAIDGLHSQLSAEGRILVLRSHSHVDFFTGVMPRSTSLVSSSLAPRHALQELFTVRHPLDSWLSLCHQGWQHQFRFHSFAEFCRRCLAMLEACRGLAVLRYEDVCLDPSAGLQRLAELLALPLDPAQLESVAAVRMSGDSGRSDSRIGPRPRRPLPTALAEELAGNPTPYLSLCSQLGYNPDPAAAHPFTTSPCPL